MGFELTGDDEAGRPKKPQVVTRIIRCTKHTYGLLQVDSEIFDGAKTQACINCGAELIAEVMKQGKLPVRA